MPDVPIMPTLHGFDGMGIALLVAAALIGSFLGVLVRRIPQGESFVRGRSRCDHCRHPLGARDLLPFVSWILLKGRCRWCGARLGLFYPGIELASVAVAAGSLLLFHGWGVVASCVLGWTLLTLALMKIERGVLPDS